MVTDARHRLATVKQLPYDAEIEYLESTGTQWIDTGVYIDTNSVITINSEIQGTGTSNIGLFSAGNTTNNKAEFYIWTSRFESYIGSYSNASGFQCSVGDKLSISVNNGNVSVVNITTGITETGTYTFTGQSSHTATLFALHRSETSYTYCGKYRLFSAHINNLDLIPVRIGTTGYMYDRANPKGGPLGNGLYPNQGSGDFTLGKDVAYPKRKFEITYRKPFVLFSNVTPTAKSYIQDGLIAMWDGIENAGWGTHDANAMVWKDLVGNRHWTNLPNHLVWTDNSAATSGGGFGVSASESWQVQYAHIDVCGECFANNNSFVCFCFGNNKMFGILPTNNRGFQFASGKPTMGGDFYKPWSVAATLDSDNNIISCYYNSESRAANLGSSTWAAASRVQFGSNIPYLFFGAIHSLRLYSRALTAAEIAHNYAIDKIRFNLP